MLQLKKSIHLDSLGQPFKKAIRIAAELGADAVEVNGMTELRNVHQSRTAIRQIHKMLSDLNLKISAVHFPTRMGYGDLDRLDQRIEGTRAAMTLAYELGSSVVINRIGKIPDRDDDARWATMVQALTDLGNYSHRAGAWLAAKTGAESGESLGRLLNQLPPHTLMVDFDPAELVINGFSATAAMDVLADRVVSFRARDAVTDLSLGRGLEVQMGRGTVDWPALLGRLEESNYEGYLTVERQSAEQPVVECGQALQYLSELFR